ncbi:MAG: HNH endonuclease, partial [Candidatus Omnitrophica bacterium]|nr:HNH endonuclease [Candidatus Omnitrophota bacterium]
MPNKKCKICGREFYVKPFHAKKGWGKYCSIKCRTKAQFKGKWVECAYCGKKIWRTPKDFKRSKRNKFFCNVACHCSWENKNVRYGINAPNWITGESAYRDLMRRCKVPVKCRKCGVSDKRVLMVHHKDGNRRSNNIENLEWLCY